MTGTSPLSVKRSTFRKVADPQSGLVKNMIYWGLGFFAWGDGSFRSQISKGSFSEMADSWDETFPK